MSTFVLEALFIGGKEGVKLSFCLLVVLLFLRSAGRDRLRRPVAAGVAAVFLASLLMMQMTVTFEMREVIVKMVGYVFGVFYFLSLGALFHETGSDLLGPLRPLFGSERFLAAATFLLTLVYFAPDMTGSSLYVADLAAMADARLPVFLAGGAGFTLSIAASSVAGRKAPASLARLFGLSQVLAVLALVKLLAGGVRGFAELTLIPAVQAGLMKLVHDVVHQLFVFVLVPDHPVLSTTAWNFIGVLFRETAGLWLSLLLLSAPLTLFIIRHFREPVRVPGDIVLSSRKRIFLKAIRDERILKSLPLFLFMLLMVSLWFHQKDEPGVKLYLPDPRPVAAEGDTLSLPLQSPAADLRDGLLHKFTLTLPDGEQARLMLMKKPDGTLAVCLDACEICQPDGYGQSREHVVCLFCRTPIPFDTVGKPGGCNPIPLAALVSDRDVKISLREIAEKWSAMKSGSTREIVQ